jgi:hypothetical protein
MLDDPVTRTTNLSPAPSPSVLQASLELLCGSHSGFDDHIKRLAYGWEPKSHQLDGEFLYPLFGAGGPNIDALVEHIYQSLVPFCLPRGEIQKIKTAAMAAGDMNAIIALGDRARAMFVQTRSAALTGGEAGELLLFLILEALVKAPLLVSKMSLKTNSNMNIHGRDGIHVRFCPTLKGLVLHLGESKLHKGLAAAVDDAITSITEYLGDRALRVREIEILNANMDLTGIPAETEHQLRAILNPYTSPPPVYHTSHTCFIGFEYGAYAKVAGLASDAVEVEFQKLYTKRAAEIAALIQKKAGTSLPPPANLRFFVMPFPNLEHFRKTFAQKLGVKVD